MKHSILTYTLLAAMIAAPVPGMLAAQDNKTPQQIAAEKAKADAEAKKKAAEEAAKKKAAEQARLKAEREAKQKAEAAYRAQNQALGKYFDGLYKKRMSYAQRIEETKKLLSDPLNADPRLQRRILGQIINYCQQPPWTHIGEYKYETANTELPPAAQKIMDDPTCKLQDKLFAIRSLAYHYCDRQMFDKAEALLKHWFADTNATANDRAELLCIQANVYRLQDKYELAMKTCREAMTFNKTTGAQNGALIAISFRNVKAASAIWNEANNKFAKLRHLGTIWQKAYLKKDFLQEAIAFVKDTNNKPGERLEIARIYLFEDYGSKEQDDARRSLAGIPAQLKTGGWQWKNSLTLPYQMGDYALQAEICEIFAGSPFMQDPAMQRIHVTSLGALGKKAEGAKIAAEYAQNEKCKPVDLMKFKFYEAILSGKPTDSLMNGTTLTRKEQSEVIRSAARQCLTWGMSGLSEKYAAQYEKFFAEKPDRVLKVKFCDQPVNSIADWRKLYDGLDKQMCDIKFQGSMDFLETDVATGSRSVNIDKNSKNTDRMELSAVCDKLGLHIFLRVKTDKARKVEQGFAGGIGTEMYFAPGWNQPYICMGSEPTKGVTFMFQTTYNNKNHQRPDMNNHKNSFHDEIDFSDNDYVLHMFFAWDDYYNKLPENGSEYRFECISWCPDGGYSWGGSQGVHSASVWGSLKFEMSKKQLNAIRRQLIYKTYKNYKMAHRDPATSENLFDVWADPEIGDPDFYQEKLAPLQKELDSYAALVKEDMTDADVENVYSQAFFRWKGLKHEIDQLRRQYLEHRMLPAAK